LRGSRTNRLWRFSKSLVGGIGDCCLLFVCEVGNSVCRYVVNLSCRKGCASAAETEGLCYGMSKRQVAVSVVEVEWECIVDVRQRQCVFLHSDYTTSSVSDVRCGSVRVARLVLVLVLGVRPSSVCCALLRCVAASPTLNQSRQFSAKPNEVTVPIHFSSPPSCSLCFCLTSLYFIKAEVGHEHTVCFLFHQCSDS